MSVAWRRPRTGAPPMQHAHWRASTPTTCTRSSTRQSREAYDRGNGATIGVWSLHAEHGISGRYHEEAEVRRLLVERADRVVGLCTRDKLGTVSAFASAPATALTHLATEPGVPEELLAPFRDLGIRVL